MEIATNFDQRLARAHVLLADAFHARISQFKEEDKSVASTAVEVEEEEEFTYTKAVELYSSAIDRLRKTYGLENPQVSSSSNALFAAIVSLHCYY